MLYSISRFLFMVMLRIFFSFKIRGRENIPKKGGFLLASNHLSNLDPIVLGVASSRKLNFMAKDALFANSLFSWILFKVGAFPIKRDSADIPALKEAMRRVKRGEPLLIFPEGTRMSGMNPKGLQPGIGFLATRINVPIIPAFIRGTDAAMPKGCKLIKPTKISVCFGRQILVERGLPYQDIAQKIMESIGHLSCEVFN